MLLVEQEPPAAAAAYEKLSPASAHGAAGVPLGKRRCSVPRRERKRATAGGSSARGAGSKAGGRYDGAGVAPQEGGQAPRIRRVGCVHYFGGCAPVAIRNGGGVAATQKTPPP